MEYIDKSALVAEIERRIADNKKDIERVSHKNLEDYFEGYEDGLALLKQQFLDTLEVKEVDLEKEFELTWEDVAWIVNKGFQKCKVESTLTAEDICKDVLKQFKAYKGE